MSEIMEILHVPEDASEDAKLILRHFVNFFNRRWNSVEQERAGLKDFINQNSCSSDSGSNYYLGIAEGKNTGRLEEVGVLGETIRIAAEILGGEVTEVVLDD